MSLNPKNYLLLLVISTALGAFSLGSIISFTNPSEASLVVFVFFYISLFLVSLGLFTLFGVLIRHFFSPGLYIVNLSNSFRQAVLIAFLIVISFILLSKGLLFWWVELSLILFLAAFEAFFNLSV